MSDTEHTRATVAYAVTLLGGVEAAVPRLGFRVNQLEAFIRGTRNPPNSLFLTAADVVLGATRQQINRAQSTMRDSPVGVNSEGLQRFLGRVARSEDQPGENSGKKRGSGGDEGEQV